MTFHKRRSGFLFWEKISLALYLKWGMIALAAVGVALWLSPPELNVRAWHQSPVSPVSPLPTQPAPLPTPSPTLPVISPTPAPAIEDQPAQGNERSTALLVAGGIVLAGLIVGAVVLLVRGQPPEDVTS